MRYITIASAAKRLGVSQLHIWSLIRKGRLGTRIDNMRQVVVDAEQLDSIVVENAKREQEQEQE